MRPTRPPEPGAGDSAPLGSWGPAGGFGPPGGPPDLPSFGWVPGSGGGPPEGSTNGRNGSGPDDGIVVVPPPGDPMAVAREFVRALYTTDDGDVVLATQQGDFFAYDDTCWPGLEERRLRAQLYTWLEPASYWKKERNRLPELVSFAPTRRKVDDLQDALKAVCHVDEDVAAPGWIDGLCGQGAQSGSGWIAIQRTYLHTHARAKSTDNNAAGSRSTAIHPDPPAAGDRPPATELISLANGILHWPTRRLLPHTPAFWAHHALPFSYDRDAKAPLWESFLRELWGEEEERPATLAEIFGYALSGDTRQQKAFLLYGPPRSGRGTIARVLTGLYGEHNVAGPSLASLSMPFGLQSLLGVPLALLGDVRLGPRADVALAVERLLSIVGEDRMTVDRKHKGAWTGRLPTRFLLLSNELPRLDDASGALPKRLIVVRFTEDFFGREDETLTDSLLAEAPGILNWALDGLDRLRERGHFVQPSSSEDAVQLLADMASPVAAFVRARCELGAGFEESPEAVYADYRSWCIAEGHTAMSSTKFISRLQAAFPAVSKGRPRRDGKRPTQLLGIRLRSTPAPDQPDRGDLDWHGTAPLDELREHYQDDEE